jgi:hypothetical protein
MNKEQANEYWKEAVESLGSPAPDQGSLHHRNMACKYLRDKYGMAMMSDINNSRLDETITDDDARRIYLGAAGKQASIKKASAQILMRYGFRNANRIIKLAQSQPVGSESKLSV